MRRRRKKKNEVKKAETSLASSVSTRSKVPLLACLTILFAIFALFSRCHFGWGDVVAVQEEATVQEEVSRGINLAMSGQVDSPYFRRPCFH
jgi:hypothetical protein